MNTIPPHHILCNAKQSVPGGKLRWNFMKFLVDRSGKPLARYEVSTDPADVDFHVVIEKALAGKLKPAGVKGKEASAGEDDNDN